MTRACMVCRTIQSYDDLYSTYRPIPGLEHQYPEAQQIVYYCRDNPQCIAVATAPGAWNDYDPRRYRP